MANVSVFSNTIISTCKYFCRGRCASAHFHISCMELVAVVGGMEMDAINSLSASSSSFDSFQLDYSHRRIFTFYRWGPEWRWSENWKFTSEQLHRQLRVASAAHIEAALTPTRERLSITECFSCSISQTASKYMLVDILHRFLTLKPSSWQRID